MKRRHDRKIAEILIGIALIVIGALTVFRPVGVFTWVVIACGLIAILTGVADIIIYVRMESFMGFGPTVSLVTGILSVMVGFMLVVHPGAGTWAIALVLPIWVIAHCISRLCHLNHIRMISGDGAYYYTLVLHILGLILGVMMLVQPGLSFMSLGVLAGVYLILLGIDCLVTGIKYDNYDVF